MCSLFIKILMALVGSLMFESTLFPYMGHCVKGFVIFEKFWMNFSLKIANRSSLFLSLYLELDTLLLL